MRRKDLLQPSSIMTWEGPATIRELLETSNVVGSISEYEAAFKQQNITMVDLRRQILGLPELEKLGINFHSDRMKLLDTQRAMQLMASSSLTGRDSGRDGAKQPLSSHWMLPRKFEKPSNPKPLDPRHPT